MSLQALIFSMQNNTPSLPSDVNSREYIEAIVAQSKSDFYAAPTVYVSDFSGATDSDIIDAALAYVEAQGTKYNVILDTNPLTSSNIWNISRAIELPSDCYFIIDGQTVKMANGVTDNILRNKGLEPNATYPNGACDALNSANDIHVVGLSGAKLEGATTPGDTGDGTWRNIGVLFANCNTFSVTGLEIKNTHSWGLTAFYKSKHFVFDDITFTQTKSGINEDGIDIRKSVSHGVIKNISGTTQDDTIALTSLIDATATTTDVETFNPAGDFSTDTTSLTPTSLDDISYIYIDTINTTSAVRGILLLSGAGQVRNIQIDNVDITSQYQTLRVFTGSYGVGYNAVKDVTINNLTGNVTGSIANYVIEFNEITENVTIDTVYGNKTNYFATGQVNLTLSNINN